MTPAVPSSTAAVPAVPITAAPPLVHSTSINSAEAAQLVPIDLNASAVEIQAGGAAAPSSSAGAVPASVGTPPIVSASGPGAVVGTTGVGSSAAISAVTTSVPAPRPSVRPAATNIPPSGTRPPFRPPPAQPAPVPDQREREMAALRAQIQEKEVHLSPFSFSLNS